MNFDIKSVEESARKKWKDGSIFAIDVDHSKPKYYILEMFPYPSGSLHMGHLRNYTMGDVVARFQRMKGFNVLYTMGWDSFGLPAENAAIKHNIHPKEWTYNNIAKMREQMKVLGLSYDWNREVTTCNPEYYLHEQKLFLQMVERGLAYRKKSLVNWDPVDHTVLANEQVIDGRGWRSGAIVEQKELEQWFFKITDFSEDLLENLASLNDTWPESVVNMQNKWIGKSIGAKIIFDVKNTNTQLEVFSTRPDTIFGASFCAVSLEHPIINEVSDTKIIDLIKEQINSSRNNNYKNENDKLGIDSGLKAIHPFTNKELPIYFADFVLMNHGTGAIFGCPAHDKRDYDFATKYNLPIIPVVKPEGKENIDISNEPFLGRGLIFNSEFLNNMTSDEAKEKVVSILKIEGKAEDKVTYKLKDWGVSRQRYWGCPIPIIHCKDCGPVPVPEKDLPVVLPEDVDIGIKGNPLDHHPTWKKVKCPKCSKEAIRETDTFDTFMESSWYFAAFCSKNGGINKEECEYFLPVDRYIGGIEHAILHLLYARFFTKVLHRIGYFDVEEPFLHLLTQGMICHPTYKDTEGNWISPKNALEFKKKGLPVTEGPSEKMSKSKLNVVSPEEIIDKYGADTVRLFMLSDTPPEKNIEWSDDGLKSVHKYINKIYSLTENAIAAIKIHKQEGKKKEDNIKYRKILHRAVNNMNLDIKNCLFNKAISRIHEITNLVSDILEKSEGHKDLLTESIDYLIRVSSIFIPHTAETLWDMFKGKGHTISCSEWPNVDYSLLEDEDINIAVQVNGKLRSVIKVNKQEVSEDNVKKLALEELGDKKPDKIRKIIFVPNKIINIVSG